MHAVRVDPKRPGLLFAGTEKGVYVSFNDGGKWELLQLNLPMSPINDLIVKNDDLVVATHGRAFWILDDIGPLRQYNDSIPQQQAHLFTPTTTNETIFHPSFFGGQGNVGKNPPGGAVIYYWLKDSLKKPDQKAGAGSSTGESGAAGAESHESEAKPQGDKEAAGKKEPPKITLEILDSSGKVIRKLPKKEVEGSGDEEEESFGRGVGSGDLPADAGLNRFVWDQRYEGATKVPKAPLWGGNTDGPEALPGNYQVKLTVLGQSYTAPLEIVSDPRLSVTPADLQKRFDLLMKIRDQVTKTDDTIIEIRQVRDQINALNKRLGDDPNGKPIVDAGKALDKKMTPIEEALIQTKAKSGQDVLNFPVRLNNDLVALGGVVSSARTAPTQQSYEVFDLLSQRLSEQLTTWNQITSTDIPAYNNLVKQQEVPALKVTPPEAGQ